MSEAFDNPRSTDPRAAAKYASEMIDSIASQLKINIANAAQHGESFVLATKAEANLLLDRNENAALYYEQVVERPDFAPHQILQEELLRL